MKTFRTACAVILLAWISFFPQPVQDQYRPFAVIFLCIFLLAFLLDKKYQNKLFSLKDSSFLIFLLFLSAGTISATDKTLAFSTYFYLFIIFFLLFYIGKALFLGEDDAGAVAAVICFCAIAVSIIGLSEVYFGRNILYEKLIPNPFYERYIRCGARPMSTQLNPAVLGSFLLGCLPFNFLLFKNKRLRLFGIIGSLISVSVIMLAASRGVFLGLIVSLSFYLWMRKRLMLLCFFLAGVALLIAASSYQRCPDLNRFGFSRFISGSYDSMISEYRVSRVKMTAKILKEHPFTGIGFNHFRLRFDEFCDKNDSGEREEFRIPDNMYLTFLAETGLIGTLGFLIFMFFLLKNGLMRLAALKDRRKEELLIPLTALAGLLVNMGAYELFYWSNPYMLFCLICGFIQAAAAGAVKAEVASDKT